MQKNIKNSYFNNTFTITCEGGIIRFSIKNLRWF